MKQEMHAHETICARDGDTHTRLTPHTETVMWRWCGHTLVEEVAGEAATRNWGT